LAMIHARHQEVDTVFHPCKRLEFWNNKATHRHQEWVVSHIFCNGFLIITSLLSLYLSPYKNLSLNQGAEPRHRRGATSCGISQMIFHA